MLLLATFEAQHSRIYATFMVNCRLCCLSFFATDLIYFLSYTAQYATKTPYVRKIDYLKRNFLGFKNFLIQSCFAISAISMDDNMLPTLNQIDKSLL